MGLKLSKRSVRCAGIAYWVNVTIFTLVATFVSDSGLKVIQKLQSTPLYIVVAFHL